MLHMRKQIRDAVAAALAGLPMTADRVYIGRTRPLGKNHEPTLLVYTRTETSKREVRGAPPEHERQLDLIVEGRVSSSAPPDDLLDQIALEVETAMASLIDYGTGKVFDGLIWNLQYSGQQVIVEADGEKHIGKIGLQYLATYHVAEGAPDVAT
jgi:hypothetical protein